MTTTTTFPPPSQLVLTKEPADAWEDWLEEFNIFAEATELTTKPDSVQLNTLLHVLGPVGRNIYKILDLPAPAQGAVHTLQTVTRAFDTYFAPYKNVIVSRYRFLTTKQQPGQTFDAFHTELRTKADHCALGTLRDSLICTMILVGINKPELRKKLLAKQNLTLTQAAALCRAEETSDAHASVMSPVSPTRLLSPPSPAVPPLSVDELRSFRHGPMARGSAWRSRPFMYRVPQQQLHSRPPPTNRHMLYSRGRASPVPSSVCRRCLEAHPYRTCPAYNKLCDKCGGQNHFAKACRSSLPLHETYVLPDHYHEQDDIYASPYDDFDPYCSSIDYSQSTGEVASQHAPVINHDHITQSFADLHLLDKSPQAQTYVAPPLYNDMDPFHIAYLTVHSTMTTSPGDWITPLTIQNLNISFKIDTGSQVNVLPASYFNNLRDPPPLLPPRNRVLAYNGDQVPMLGMTDLWCCSLTGAQLCSFYVTALDTIPIIGATTSAALGLVQRLDGVLSGTALPSSDSVRGVSKTDLLTFQDMKPFERPDDTPLGLITEFQDTFGTVGCLPGFHDIKLKPGAKPIITPPRSVPYAYREPLKLELQRMIDLQIIRPVTEPTDWVHALVIVPKPDGSIRVCLDPRNLNAALCLPRFQMPTSQEIFGGLSGCTVFSVLDVSAAFWQIRLTARSSLLCTFSTIYGRFCFLRLPYGIASASEIFQCQMQTLLEHIPCVYISTDDILLAARSLVQHNAVLRAVLTKAQSSGIKFNPKKLQLAKSEVTYLGHIISPNGVRIHQNRTAAIHAIPAPANKKALQSFLGVINFLSKFIPNHAAKTAPLRMLLRNNSTFIWDANSQKHFDDLKAAVTAAPVLAFYSPHRQCIISADASQTGIGAVLLQDDHPISYASTSLTFTQQRYAQIEKELLAIVYALEHFHFYISGTEPVVQTDHKPLLAVVKRPLHVLSPRLQRLVLRLTRYNPRLVYIPGPQMYISDALSRAPLQITDVDTSYLEGPHSALHSMTTLSADREAEMQHHVSTDPDMLQLLRYAQHGWPRYPTSLAPQLKRFWPHKAEIFCQDGDRLIIPAALREKVMHQLHGAHQGINSCLRKARLHVYWPGLTADLTSLIQRCSFCQSQARAQSHVVTTPHPVPTRPWEIVGMDLFHHGHQQLLLCVDYYSKYLEVDELHTTTAAAVIRAIKPHFARHGTPQRVISDNGPPFNSREFADFLNQWGVAHTTSSPHFPQSNGMAERHIQTIKNLLPKAKAAGVDPHYVLLEYRSTPQASLPSPSEMLMGRLLRTPSTTTSRVLLPHYPTLHMDNALDARRSHLIHPSAQLPRLYEVGTPVRYLASHRNWIPAVVVAKTEEPDSYIIETSTGARYRRTGLHLKPDNTFDLTTRHLSRSQTPEPLVTFPSPSHPLSSITVSYNSHKPRHSGPTAAAPATDDSDGGDISDGDPTTDGTDTNNEVRSTHVDTPIIPTTDGTNTDNAVCSTSDDTLPKATVFYERLQPGVPLPVSAAELLSRGIPVTVTRSGRLSKLPDRFLHD